MELNNADIIQPNVENQEVEEEPKRPKGRPNITGIVCGEPEYFKKYYHLHQKEKMICECGAEVTRGCFLKHTKRATHRKRMKLINV